MGSLYLKRGSQGFTLVEVLIAMAIGGILLGAVVSTFILQSRSYDVQEQMTEMVQTARAAMDMIGREVRMAGYDPTGAGFEGIPYHGQQLQLLADLRGANPTDPPDGDTSDPNENIIYSYDADNLQIDRNTGGGNQPFAENIESFAFTYLDEDGCLTTNAAHIRQISVTITVRAARPDPEYAPQGGYRSFTLASLITPANLACR